MMKCQYCGGNLSLEDEVCPYCGRENTQAAEHLAVMRDSREENVRTKKVVGKKVKISRRTAKIVVIALQVLIVAVILIRIPYYSDIDTREKRNQQKIEAEVEANRSTIAATLAEMEKNREYLAMDAYVLDKQLRTNGEYQEYARVFTAVADYETIYSDIVSIVAGFTGYDGTTGTGWCKNIAIYISDWNKYVGGEFWRDSADSPMHAGEHGAFLSDIKRDTQDMVQVYFQLTDEQAAGMWSMDREAVEQMLCEQYEIIYGGGKANE